MGTDMKFKSAMENMILKMINKPMLNFYFYKVDPIFDDIYVYI